MSVCIGSPHNYGNRMNGGVINFIFLNKIIKRALVFVMSEFNIWYIKGNSVKFLCFCFHIKKRNKKEFSFRINKTFDEPGTGNPVYFWPFTGDPSHLN